jgi:hypothetical protein
MVAEKESSEMLFAFQSKSLRITESSPMAQLQLPLADRPSIQGGREEREVVAAGSLQGARTWYEEVEVPKRKDAGKSLRWIAEAAHGRSQRRSQAPASNCRHAALPAMSQVSRSR